MGAYRPRATRTAVVVQCRMNSEGVWTDACIHNVSSRGLLVSADKTPRVGSYVDIRRGTLVIIGRVIWVKERRFGIRTQDLVSAALLVNEPVLKNRPAADQILTDRRMPTRTERNRSAAVRAERSRRFASGFQFVCLATASLGVAALAAVEIYHALVAPFGKVAGALGRTGG
ncbi:PilZ domain-containing protein [Sphingomonas sp. STIS6.2]|uniref:PilZ domain-containing protein n=1 Tax=Sphingomonas sp. STIS6.2 TaxID=1379700 RepID=UPI000D13EC13